MIEHEPHVGNLYQSGIDGRRVAIVGYSHYRKPNEADTNDFTIEVVGEFQSGKHARDTLLRNVMKCFGSSDREGFWESVLFFNYIPECIGIDKYQEGTDEQKTRGNARFLRYVEKHLPHQVFVFTAKGWQRNLKTVFADIKQMAPDFPTYRRAVHTTGGHVTEVFALRHTNYADLNELKRAVEFARTAL